MQVEFMLIVSILDVLSWAVGELNVGDSRVVGTVIRIRLVIV